MQPLRPLSPLAAGETTMRGISMWTRRSEPTRGMVGRKSVLGVGELKVIDDLGQHIFVFITLIGPFDIFTS
jgi:hypothetical protein